ncbi:hypothetical protein [Amycolatopsis azurea]|uniref:Uncharacterized protein n=1 Tax=Amycolatopsis azurea DSM 43854 TaxID=1238180 RepID=M2QEL2_9PSEU|nr:hypothetical protein [Amycolatopsis azurea]EMD24467.1 hypothetical protein C791_5835 [Amycolatopsis azurea DSM 43854]OOC01144.1 hypothetical protein B0293_39720 [Amycolatopsis azurea DSM 43854]
MLGWSAGWFDAIWRSVQRDSSSGARKSFSAFEHPAADEDAAVSRDWMDDTCVQADDSRQTTGSVGWS